MKKFPKLYHQSKTGAIVEWEVWADTDKVYTVWGQTGGVKQTAVYSVTPTNLGRANQRDVEAQAEFEANALWTNKKERKYSETPEDAKKPLFLPMLSKVYDKKKVDFSKQTVWVQPKLNGLRCLAEIDDGEVTLYSRSGKTYNVDHIESLLSQAFPKGYWVLDGELYIHGKMLQDLNSLVKRSKPGSENLQYHIYDCPIQPLVSNTEIFSMRFLCFKAAATFDQLQSESLIIVPTNSCKDHNKAKELFAEYLAAGFEGAMIRLDGPYEWGYRSSNLLKVKEFQDAEYKVVDIIDGVGKFAGLAICICETFLGSKFKVVPKGSAEYRKSLFDNKDKYIGQLLTVQYFDLSKDRIPTFPVGLGFRIPEDMDANHATG